MTERRIEVGSRPDEVRRAPSRIEAGCTDWCIYPSVVADDRLSARAIDGQTENDMKRLDWTLGELGDFASACATEDLRPKRLPDTWLRRLLDAAQVVDSGAHPCSGKAFDALCGVILRLRLGEWRRACGSLHVPLPELWQAIVEYGAALEREHAARLSAQGGSPLSGGIPCPGGQAARRQDFDQRG